MKNDDYSDIMNLPHHVSSGRRRMSSVERAAQFSPFAALVGYDAAIREEARLTWNRRELAEDEKTALDRKFRLLSDRISSHPWVCVTCFLADERKDGGAYVTMEGALWAISSQDQWLQLEGEGRIPFSDILRLQSDALTEEYL